MPATTMLIFLAAGIIFLFIFLYFVPVNLWITAIFSGVQVDLIQLVFMRIRKTPPSLIINNLISLNKSGIDVSIMDLETHYLSSGNVEKVAKSMISLKNKGQEISWKQASAMDLAGYDIEKYLHKIKLEKEDGIGEMRKNLSDAILNDLNAEQVKELARIINNMMPKYT